MLSSCRSTKKITRTIPEVAKDSITVTVVTPDSAATDSARRVDLNLGKIKNNKIDFNTFSARVKMDYDGEDKKFNDITAFVRIKKDSAIWVSLNAVLGIEAFRVFITPDSVKLLDKLNKTYQSKGFSYLQEITKLPINFSILQDLLLGNTVFLGDTVFQSYTSETIFQVVTIGDVFKNISDFLQPDLFIKQTRLQSLDTVNPRSANLEYGGFETNANRNFSTMRKLSVSDKKTLKIDLDFKQVVFDNPVNFPFAVPGNYKLK